MKTNIPLILKNIEIKEVQKNDFDVIGISKCSLLQTSKLLCQSRFKKTSNFIKIEK